MSHYGQTVIGRGKNKVLPFCCLFFLHKKKCQKGDFISTKTGVVTIMGMDYK